MDDAVTGGSVADFLDRVAARTPAPGGGGACAVAVALAGALVAMAARFSDRQLPDADQLSANADALRAQALPLVDADAAAYQRLLDAYRSRAPDRSERIATAARAASEVPLRMTDLAARTATLAARVATAGNQNLYGDAHTAALLCAAAARAATTLVDVNVAAGSLDRQLTDTARAHAATTADAVRRIEAGGAARS